MNMEKITLIRSCKGLALAALMFWPALLSAKVQQESVFFYRVEGAPPNERLVIDKSRSFESNCEQEPHDGCVNVRKYYTGLVGFVLEGSDRNCQAGDDLWKLDSVRIGGVTRLRDPGPKPETWGGLDDLDGKRSASDFGADRDTGETRYQKRKRFPDALWILDLNWYLVSTWYQVTAVHCSDPGRTATAEGRIDNRGQ